MGQLGLFCKKSGRFNLYHILTYYIPFHIKLYVLSEYQGFGPIDATIFEKTRQVHNGTRTVKFMSATTTKIFGQK